MVYLIALFGLIVGIVMSIVSHHAIPFYTTHLKEAQASYTRCVTDGAPPDNCVKTYLLPKEEK